ncbi:MAG: heavy metal translocating P-type ATPase [Erysipelotrichaceae bacterium]|nr:heavy metal translocating P-type ATPase [Erysipelotrichaceae bacterium]
MIKRKYKIEGMFCSACESHVQKAALKGNGVTSANVSLLTNTMEVTFSHKIDDESIIDNVKKAGYKASVYEDDYAKRKSFRKRLLNTTLAKLIVSITLLIALMYFSMGAMFNWPLFELDSVNLGIQMSLTLVIMVIYFSYFIKGFKGLFKLHPTMESLISLGSLVSFIYGVFAFSQVVIGEATMNMDLIHKWYHNVYFEAGAMIIVLVSLGKFLEAIAKDKTTSSLEHLLSLTPDTAIVKNGDEYLKVAVKDLKVGDIIVIKPGDSIPIDGTITKGYGYLEESALTGEPLPRYKKVGDLVIGGSINQNGFFLFKVSSVGKDTTLAKIISLVEEASSSKARLALLADKVSSVFVPIVIVLSLLTFTIWYLVTKDIELAVNFGVSVLVISCPCALGLATPVAIMVGTGKGAENGILLKSAQAFESLSKVKTIAFDKTGTLTSGHLKIIDYVLMNKKYSNIDSIIYSSEEKSNHPLSMSIVKYFEDKKTPKTEIKDFDNLPGLGIKTTYKDKDVYIGSAQLMKEIGVNEELPLGKENYSTLVYVSIDHKLIAFIELVDAIKEDAIKALAILKKEKYHLVLISGDNALATSSLASKVGIKEYYANVKPNEKQAIVNKLQSNGQLVAMVGDGINDAPALETADIGIAIGSGANVAIDCADVVLMNPSLLDLVNSLYLSKKVVKNIKMNLFYAFIYNIIGIPLAAGLLFYTPLALSLNPMIASGIMSISSLTVVINALLLKRINFHKKNKKEEVNNENSN